MTTPHDDNANALRVVLDLALQRVTKWRAVFAGWQLGTRAKGDPEGDAVRDHRELSILMRIELSALAGLLIEKGVFTTDDWMRQLAIEADALNESYEVRFPGVEASQMGITIDIARAQPWMKGWRP